ncbi:MAG: replicative DNA helicase [Bacteroidales bacterium]|jgi:replicative DNA helicase|nr:replicative DNA helicase [Bacteroidales bacterium]
MRKKDDGRIVFESGVGRLMPQVCDLEEATLGAILLDRDAYPTVSEILKPESFYKKEHGLIFRAIVDLAAGGMPVDMLTVVEQLRRNGSLEEAGGPFYVCQLTGKVASAAHLKAHATIIAEKYFRRQLIEMSMRAEAGCFDGTEVFEEVLARINADIESLMERSAPRGEAVILGEALKKSINEAYVRREKVLKGGEAAITTGFAALDRIMAGGWKGGQLGVLAARPSVGKSSLALHMAKRAAMRRYCVALFSMEMSETELADRLVVGESGIDKNRYRSGCQSDGEMKKAEEAAFGSLYGLNISIFANENENIAGIVGKMRLLKKKGMCDMVIIDYLQLITPTSGIDVREQQVSEMSRALKKAAGELGVPIVALSQMNRDIEKRGNRRPQLSDLRESGSLEQDADVVMFLQKRDGIEDEGNILDVIVEKNRDGETGTVKVVYNESMTAFFDYDYGQFGKFVHPPVEHWQERAGKDDEERPF